MTYALALEILRDGNRRFVEERPAEKNIGIRRRYYLAEEGQNPLAVIVTCSDSRIVPEYIFDQGLGDLFVVRVLGNVIDNFAMGSIEYAVEQLKVGLIIVLGHEKCRIIKAAVDSEYYSENFKKIAALIEPAICGARKKFFRNTIYETVADINIQNMVRMIKENVIVKLFIETNEVAVIGAKYHLITGEVWFSDK